MTFEEKFAQLVDKTWFAAIEMPLFPGHPAHRYVRSEWVKEMLPRALAEWLAGEIDEWAQKYAGGLLGPTFHGSLKARLGLPPYDKPAKPEVDVGTEVRKCALEVKDVIWKLADRLEEE